MCITVLVNIICQIHSEKAFILLLNEYYTSMCCCLLMLYIYIYLFIICRHLSSLAAVAIHVLAFYSIENVPSVLIIRIKSTYAVKNDTFNFQLLERLMNQISTSILLFFLFIFICVRACFILFFNFYSIKEVHLDYQNIHHHSFQLRPQQNDHRMIYYQSSHQIDFLLQSNWVSLKMIA
jgi:hypothetical protein